MSRAQAKGKAVVVVLFSVVLVAIGALGILGSLLDRVQRVEAEVRLPAGVADVWGRVAVDRTQAWRSDLARVEVIDDQRWIEHPRSGPPVRFAAVRVEAPRRFVVAFEGSGFRGTWDGSFVEEAGATVLRFSEEVDVENPFMRVVARLFFGPDRAMARYRADLERSFAAAGPTMPTMPEAAR